MPSRYVTTIANHSTKVSESAEWNAQRNAVTVSERMRSFMRHAAGSPGVYVKTFEL